MAGLFSSLPVYQASLDFHRERHAVLASNVANVDTPGFRSLELVRSEEASELGGPWLRLQRSAEAHFGTGGARAGEPGTLTPDTTAPVGADGNSVSLDREMSKLAANDLRYETVTTLVRSYFGGLRYAASDFTG